MKEAHGEQFWCILPNLSLKTRGEDASAANLQGIDHYFHYSNAVPSTIRHQSHRLFRSTRHGLLLTSSIHRSFVLRNRLGFNKLAAFPSLGYNETFQPDDPLRHFQLQSIAYCTATKQPLTDYDQDLPWLWPAIGLDRQSGCHRSSMLTFLVPPEGRHSSQQQQQQQQHLG